MGSEGCVAIDTPQTISFERLAPGEKPPPPAPKPPKPTKEQVKAQQLEVARQKALAQQQKEARQKALAQQQKKQQANEPPKDPPKPQPKELEAEEHEKIPEFDLQDVPIAMEKMGWVVSAKIARKWFAGKKNIWDDDLNSIQPLDDTTVTLDWTLKFGRVKEKYNYLLSNMIYSENAIKVLKYKFGEIFENKFKNSFNIGFNTTQHVNDLRLFHKDWHFQFAKIENNDTTEDVLTFTDLTGALANFNIYVAVGNVEVSGERYYKYNNEKQTKTLCIDPLVKITHVYVYIKDNYSFNDVKGSNKSQYLGHWNKNGMIVTTGGLVSQLIDGIGVGRTEIYTDMGNSISSETRINWGYLMGNPLDKPVDKRTGMVRKLIEKDVYFPVYNKTYNEWREKHKKGMDFMIYSKPKYMKLKKPIEFSMDTICRPSEKM